MKLGIIRVPGAKLLRMLLAVGGAFSLLPNSVFGAGSDSASNTTLTVSLTAQETSYSVINASLGTTAHPQPFKKEPQLGKGAVRRGLLEFSGASLPAMAFLWDQSRETLYLDLNRNEDLTDDPGGVFQSRGTSASGSNYRYAFFPNVRLTVQTKAGSYPWVADLNFNEYSGRLNIYGAQKSFWSAKVNVAGQECQVGLVANLSDRLDAPASGHLLLRPWSRKNEAFEVGSGAVDVFAFPSKLFYNGHLYQAERTWVAEGDKLVCQLKLTEKPATVGQLKLSGQYLRRVLLTGGPCVAVLDSPSEIVQVPVGRYQNYQVQVGQSNNVAYLEERYNAPPQFVEVASNVVAQLAVGGPLTNTVSISRHGQLLALSYQLRGAGDHTYQLKSRDYQNPPRFTIYQGERQLASGKFEFG